MHGSSQITKSNFLRRGHPNNEQAMIFCGSSLCRPVWQPSTLLLSTFPAHNWRLSKGIVDSELLLQTKYQRKRNNMKNVNAKSIRKVPAVKRKNSENSVQPRRSLCVVSHWLNKIDDAWNSREFIINFEGEKTNKCAHTWLLLVAACCGLESGWVGLNSNAKLNRLCSEICIVNGKIWIFIYIHTFTCSAKYAVHYAHFYIGRGNSRYLPPYQYGRYIIPNIHMY